MLIESGRPTGEPPSSALLWWESLGSLEARCEVWLSLQGCVVCDWDTVLEAPPPLFREGH